MHAASEETAANPVGGPQNNPTPDPPGLAGSGPGRNGNGNANGHDNHGSDGPGHSDDTDPGTAGIAAQAGQGARQGGGPPRGSGGPSDPAADHGDPAGAEAGTPVTNGDRGGRADATATGTTVTGSLGGTTSTGAATSASGSVKGPAARRGITDADVVDVPLVESTVPSPNHAAEDMVDRAAAATAAAVTGAAGQAARVLASWTEELAFSAPASPGSVPGHGIDSNAFGGLAGLAAVAVEGLEQVLPDEIEQLVDLIPVDLPSLDAALGAILPEVDQAGGALYSLLTPDGFSPWLMGAAATTASLLALRRVSRADRRKALVGEDGGESISSWLLDMTSTES